jgi:hypothetical protein
LPRLLEQLDKRRLERAAHALSVLDALVFDALACPLQDRLSRRDADVRADQQLLQLLPERLVDAPAAVEQPGDLAEEAAPRPFQHLLRLLLKLLGGGLGLLDGDRRLRRLGVGLSNLGRTAEEAHSGLPCGWASRIDANARAGRGQARAP